MLLITWSAACPATSMFRRHILDRLRGRPGGRIRLRLSRELCHGEAQYAALSLNLAELAAPLPGLTNHVQ